VRYENVLRGEVAQCVSEETWPISRQERCILESDWGIPHYSSGSYVLA